MFAPRSLLLPRMTARFSGRTAAVDGRGGMLDYATLAVRAAGLADRLVAAGAGPGVAVAHLCRNRVSAVWRSYAIQLAGAAEVALNAGLAVAGIAYSLEVMDARLLVGDAADVAAHADGRTPVDDGDGHGSAMAPFRWPLPDPADPARRRHGGRPHTMRAPC